MQRWHFKLIGLAFVIGLSLSTAVKAQESGIENKSYHYRQINTQISVKEDSTLEVVEKITFNFVGNYHTAWRQINLDRITAITDVVVLDGTTLEPLQPSNRQLDKIDSESWGKYTYWRETGNQNIAWYFDLANTEHTWIIKYVVHGAISFGKNQDRLYWDIFTDYSEPVEVATVQVSLPQALPADQIIAIAYTSKEPHLTGSYNQNTGTAEFMATNFEPGDDFTIDLGFPVDLVSRTSWWHDWLKFTWGYLMAGLMAVMTVAFIFLRWYFTEKKKIGRGTIVPQYEPPQELKPAMAEIICKERLTDKGLAATVINLAIRGYLTIQEDFGTNWLTKLGGKQYKLIKKTDYSTDSKLEDYERQYLDILFSRGNTFATREVKHWSNSDKRDIYKSIQELKISILKETEMDTKAFATLPSKEIKAYAIGMIIFVMFVVALVIIPFGASNQLLVALTTMAAAGFIIWLVYKYEARLSLEGRILKEDWLGFKMFLETAERYRLQNLTPQTFEKFLPYAMIFGIEKKWAQAFVNINLPEPNWYAGTVGINSTNAAGVSNGFSAAAFSASFSSSFTSAFSSSAGGSAGGGGAGGGGGGGGGGAG